MEDVMAPICPQRRVQVDDGLPWRENAVVASLRRGSENKVPVVAAVSVERRANAPVY